MIENKRAITISSYVSMFFLGVGASVIGAAARNIGLTPYQIGLLLAVQNLGFMIAVAVTGSLSDIYEKPKLLFIGSILLALSFPTFYLKNSFLLNLLIMFFIGAGTGTYEGVTDAMLLDIHRERESLYININHFFVTFGSLMITLYLVFLQMNWRKSVVQSGAAVMVLAIVFALTKLKNVNKPADRLFVRIRSLGREKVVLLLSVATICTVGLEMGTVGLMTSFLMELRAFTQVTSKIGLIIFLTGIALGRILIGFYSRNDQIFGIILILFGLATLFLSCFYFIDTKDFTYIIIFFSGTTVSALLPLIITLAGLTYKEMSGTVLGLIKLAIPVGGILIPFLISIISRYFSFSISLILFPVISLSIFFILLLNRKNFQFKRI